MAVLAILFIIFIYFPLGVICQVTKNQTGHSSRRSSHRRRRRF